MRGKDDLGLRNTSGFDRRRLLKLFGAAGAAGGLSSVLAACGSSPSASNRSQILRVGLVFPDSGSLKSIGSDMLAGFSSYLSVSNQRIGGMSTTVDSIDEGTSADTGAKAVRAALKSGSYDVIVGIANSAVLGQISPDVTKAAMPVIATGGAPESLLYSQYLWRVGYTAGEAGAALGAYLGNLQGGMSTGAISRPNTIVTYDDSSADAAAETARFAAELANPNIVTRVVHGKVTSSALIDAVNEDPRPDVVFAAVSIPNVAKFVQQYRGWDIKVPLFGPGILTEQSGLTNAFKGIYTSMNYAPDLSNAANQTFTSAYVNQTNGNVPTSFAMAAYDAALVLDSALNAVPVSDAALTPAQINDAIYRAQSFNSPRGEWEFDYQGAPLQQWYLRQVGLDGRVLDNVVIDSLKTLT